MPTHIDLTCLGALAVAVDGRPVTNFPTDKVCALLAFLALEPGPHRREALAGLLWPDIGQHYALSNLRHSLHRLRHTLERAAPGIGEALFTTTRQTIEVNRTALDADVVRFENLVAQCERHAHDEIASCPECLARLGQVADLYRGELLAGFGLEGAAAFEEWLLVRRESLHHHMLLALRTLVEAHEERGDFDATLKYANRQLALDPYREDAHRQVMRALARSGQSHHALAHYDACRRLLREELGAEPDAETAALYESIGSGRFTDTEDKETFRKRQGDKKSTSTLARPNLPAQLTPFVGREDELADIGAHLHQPDVRLITMVGPGGSGKTRLALEAARARLDDFPDGVYCVSLAPLASASAIVPAVASALGLNLHSGDPKQALLQSVRDKRLLLVLDNFEHMLDSAGIVTDILHASPQVQVIATSREQLSLRGEHVVIVQGMDYGYGSDQVAPRDLIAGSAVRLFAQSARRAQLGFKVSEANLPAVLRICRLVDGMPLGLELAAAWTETLPLDTIADEIEKSADFLAADWRDAPERQRSMRAVFDWSWKLLNDTERHALRKLSVFRGGFTREAAEAIAGASLRLLASLIRKSLLRWGEAKGSTGRYEIHELLRQFAAERLNELSEESVAVETRHSQFYLNFVTTRERRLTRNELVGAAGELRGDIDNIRQAWVWAATHGLLQELDRSAYCLWQSYTLSGLSPKGEDVFVQAARGVSTLLSESRYLFDSLKRAPPEHPERSRTGEGSACRTGADGSVRAVLQSTDVSKDLIARDRLLSKLLAIHAAVLVLHSEFDQAIAVIRQAIALGEASEGVEGLVIAYYQWGEALYYKGQYEEARQVVERALQLARDAQPQHPQAELFRDAEWRANILLALSALALDEYAITQNHAAESLHLCRTWGKPRGEAVSLQVLAQTIKAEGDFATAREVCEQALPLARKLGWRWLEGRTLVEFGDAARLQGDYALAQTLTENARDTFHEIGERAYEALALANLGRLADAMGEYAQAHDWLDQSLRLSREVGARVPELHASLAMAWLCHHTGDDESAMTNADRALEMGERTGSRSRQAQALVIRAHALTGLGRLDEAAQAYERAFSLCEALGTVGVATEARAGLASIALSQCHVAQALAQVEEMLAVLAYQPRAGLDEPFFAYLTCARTLHTAGDPRAGDVLRTGRRLLQEYAGCVGDEAQVRLFLEGVPVHRDLWQA